MDFSFLNLQVYPVPRARIRALSAPQKSPVLLFPFFPALLSSNQQIKAIDLGSCCCGSMVKKKKKNLTTIHEDVG